MTTRHLISFDWAMKRLLRNKSNYDILEGFLSVLLCRDIIIKHIGESQGNKANEADKYNIVDIFVEADRQELIIIELQYDSEYDYFQRMLYGVSKSIIEHIRQKEQYSTIRKVYSVNIVHFDLGTGDDYVYHGTTNFTGLHTKDELILSEDQKKVYVKDSIPEIFPEYYIIKVRKFKEEIKDALDEWIYYFKTSTIKDDFNARGMNKVRETLAYENLTEAEKGEYDRNAKAAIVRDSELHTKFVEGKIEGKTEGEAIGLEKGEAKGEIKKACAIALKLLKKGMPKEEVAEISDLSIEEINKLIEIIKQDNIK